MIMVKAGRPVDATIEQLVPLLEEGDIIIDGGNSHYPDSTRRTQELAEQGILYVGSGVSGGEEGARFGPSIMPGGAPDAWPHIKPIFQAIAAKVADGTPCCDWLGEEGAGHFVKMVHNGIEYGDMQLICEAYDLMRHVLGNDRRTKSAQCLPTGMRESWNPISSKSRPKSWPIKDEDGEPMVDKILDTAGQKGTGKWTAVSALEMGTPLTLIGEAVFARFLSALKEERVAAATELGSASRFNGDKQAFMNDLRDALYAAKIISYAQGYMLIRPPPTEYGWHLEYGKIALMWRGGCIIRAAFLDDIKAPTTRIQKLTNLLLDLISKNKCRKRGSGLAAGRRQSGIAAFPCRPCPALWPFMMATAANDYLPIYCRAQTRLLRRAYLRTSRQPAANSSIPIGREGWRCHFYDL